MLRPVIEHPLYFQLLDFVAFMKFINPKITVQNIEDEIFWLVRMEHTFAEGEYIDIQLTVPRDAQQGLASLQKRLLIQTQAKLQRLIDHLAGSEKSLPEN